MPRLSMCFATTVTTARLLVSMATVSVATAAVAHAATASTAVAAAVAPSPATAACPCSNPAHCNAITTGPRQEVLAFETNATAWPGYDYGVVTTIAWFAGGGGPPAEMVCNAHAHGVRVVLEGLYAVADLGNATKRAAWVQAQLENVQAHFADGVNVDVEEPIVAGTPAVGQLTSMVGDLTAALHTAVPGSQVSFDAAWSPDCIDGRCYDYKGLADASDFLLVMSYDERSQIKPPAPCVAGANSGLSQTQRGIDAFLDLGISPSKLVEGVPWYGYKYQCLTAPNASNVCPIKQVPFRGVPCSDAAGSEVALSGILALQPVSTGGVQWDAATSSQFMNVPASGSGGTVVDQYWFDDVRSLKLKYAYAMSRQLRGCGMWNADQLTYGKSFADSPLITQQMWGAIGACATDRPR